MSPRELQIAEDLCEGLSLKQCAVHRGIAASTVSQFRGSVRQKLKLDYRAPLALLVRALIRAGHYKLAGLFLLSALCFPLCAQDEATLTGLTVVTEAGVTSEWSAPVPPTIQRSTLNAQRSTSAGREYIQPALAFQVATNAARVNLPQRLADARFRARCRALYRAAHPVKSPKDEATHER